MKNKKKFSFKRPFWWHNMFFPPKTAVWISWRALMRVEIRATLYLWRKRGQGAAARRHNRIQDTLPQPHFTAVILTPPHRLLWACNDDEQVFLYLSPSSHINTQKHSDTSSQTEQNTATGIRSSLWGELWSWLGAVGTRKQDNSFWGSRERCGGGWLDRMCPSESQSGRGIRTRLCRVTARMLPECLECRSYLIKVKNKRGARKVAVAFITYGEPGGRGGKCLGMWWGGGAEPWMGSEQPCELVGALQTGDR